MAEIVENNEKFPNPTILKTPFLSSIRDFKPEGVRLGIERVSKLFVVKQEPSKAQIMVEFCVMDDMPKCRLAELDEDGEYIVEKDELTGKEFKKLTLGSISEDDVMLFPMFMPCGKPKKIANDEPFTIYPTSSSYPLFKLALQNAGGLPANMDNKAFATTYEELKDALEGFIFLAKCEEIKGKYNFMRMAVEEAQL